MIVCVLIACFSGRRKVSGCYQWFWWCWWRVVMMFLIHADTCCASIGNVYTRFAEITSLLTDPVTGELKKKNVYIIFYKSAAIERKITKICDAFNARRYPVPDLDDLSRVRQIVADNTTELDDTRLVVGKNKDARFQLCKVLASSWEEWMWLVVREKSIYHTLNMFKSDVSGMLRGEGWLVSSGFQKARATMNEAHSRFESAMPCLLERVSYCR